MINPQLESLLYAYDLYTLGYPTALDESLRTFVVTQEMLDVEAPSLEERVMLVAINSLHQKYKEQYPEATKDEFSTKVAPLAIQTVVNYVKPRLSEPVELNRLQKFHKVQFLTLTRVSLDKQVVKS